MRTKSISDAELRTLARKNDTSRDSQKLDYLMTGVRKR